MNVCMFLKINVKYETIEKTPAYYEHSISWYNPLGVKGGENHLWNKTYGKEISWTNLSNKLAIKAAVFSR